MAITEKTIVNKKYKYYSHNELENLFNAIKREAVPKKYIQNKNYKDWERDLCIFKIAYWCGLRASEVAMITVDDFNPLRNELYCRRLKGSFDTPHG
jgi:integrase/recombinase XerD